MPDEPSAERGPGLAWLPVAATAVYYVLPPPLRDRLAVQFLPQLVGYLALAVWATRNTAVVDRLGLQGRQVTEGVRWGVPTGLALGLFNTSIILWTIPALGFDIGFLRDTPHARVPVILMVPWVILAIATAVELNFRGFLLGRLVALGRQAGPRVDPEGGRIIAVLISATIFAFDPFMVATFKHLHWIAVWDGIIWGMIWVRTRNLYATIIAHTVEVVMMYSIVKCVLA